MEAFWTTLSITLVQIPAIILRYIPFSRVITQKQKKSLAYCYSLCFSLQNILFLSILFKTHMDINPLLYKILILSGATSYFLINCFIIKGMLYQHIFVFGMQGSYSLFLHSFVAILLSIYAENIPPYNQFMIQSFTFLLLFLLTAYPLWYLLKDSFILNISTEHHYYWNIIWLIPVLLFFSNTIVTMDNNWINTWRQLVSRLLMGSTIFVIWKCVNLDFEEIDEKLALKSTNKLLYTQINAIKHEANIINEKDEKMRILRHDMRHNVQMLSSLINNGELSTASSILAQLNNNLENTKPIIFCKNSVINSSLLVYITRAQKENIEIISEIDIPKNIPWNSNDLAILFANVLENAINASTYQKEGEKEIRITTRYEDKKLAICVKNRFDGKISFAANGMPITSKEGHGIGMNSISAIVAKYKGHVVCSHKEGWFTISFMFVEIIDN